LCILSFPISSVQSGLAVSISLVGSNEIYAPGDTVYIISEIRNSQASGRIDVIVSYELFNDTDLLVKESTTVAIETLSSFSKTMRIPESIPSGSYLLKTTVSSLDGSIKSTASLTLKVLTVNEEGKIMVEYLMGFSLLFAIIALLYEHRRISKFKFCSGDLQRYIGKK